MLQCRLQQNSFYAVKFTEFFTSSFFVSLDKQTISRPRLKHQKVLCISHQMIIFKNNYLFMCNRRKL